LAAGCWQLASGYWLLASGYWQLAIGYYRQLPVASCQQQLNVIIQSK